MDKPLLYKILFKIYKNNENHNGPYENQKEKRILNENVGSEHPIVNKCALL